MLFQGSAERRRERALRARAARRRHAQRIDLARPHELLRDRAVEPARARALARGESHGLPAAGDDAAEARHPARRRAERAALVDGQPAVRHAGGRSCPRCAFRWTTRSITRSSARWPTSTRRASTTSRTSSRRTTRPTTRCSRSPATSTRRERARWSSVTSARSRAAGRSRRFPTWTLPPTFGEPLREVVPDDVMLPRLFLAFRSPVFGSDAVLRGERVRRHARPAKGKPAAPRARARAAGGGGSAGVHVRSRPRGATCSSSTSRRVRRRAPRQLERDGRMPRSTGCCATA